jgi:Putative prokaryotic signal transducing protein
MSDLDNHQAAFAARYRTLSDGELMKLASQPWTMSDPAWEALEDELDSRGLELPEPDAPPAPIQVAGRRNLVLLRRFRDLPEALLAKGKLDSSGVDCFLADENMVRMDWFISNLLGGVKLLVDADDFAKALKLLNEPIPDQLYVEGVGEYSQPRCPKCGSLDVAFGEIINRPWIGTNAPAGSDDDWCCHRCGHLWADVDDETRDSEPT